MSSLAIGGLTDPNRIETTVKSTTQVSDTTEISTAILEALADGEPRMWAELRRTLPGRDNWQCAEVLVELVHAGRVDAVKIGGATVVVAAFDLPAVAAA